MLVNRSLFWSCPDRDITSLVAFPKESIQFVRDSRRNIRGGAQSNNLWDEAHSAISFVVEFYCNYCY